MSAQTIRATCAAVHRRQPLPEDTDYLGKGRVAACCVRRPYHLQPDPDEMDELINHAASVYWHYLQVQGALPSKAWVAAVIAQRPTVFARCAGERPSTCAKSESSTWKIPSPAWMAT